MCMCNFLFGINVASCKCFFFNFSMPSKIINLFHIAEIGNFHFLVTAPKQKNVTQFIDIITFCSTSKSIMFNPFFSILVTKVSSH